MVEITPPWCGISAQVFPQSSGEKCRKHVDRVCATFGFYYGESSLTVMETEVCWTMKNIDLLDMPYDSGDCESEGEFPLESRHDASPEKYFDVQISAENVQEILLSRSGTEIVNNNLERSIQKKGNLCTSDLETNFSGNRPFPETVLNLETPFEYFSNFYTENLIQLICEENAMYSAQKNSIKPMNLTKVDLHNFL